jgi:hypothetical protein
MKIELKYAGERRGGRGTAGGNERRGLGVASPVHDLRTPCPAESFRSFAMFVILVPAPDYLWPGRENFREKFCGNFSGTIGGEKFPGDFFLREFFWW